MPFFEALCNHIYPSNSSFPALRKDICILTAILTRMRVGEGKRTEEVSPLNIWNHFACLFATGGSGDNEVTRVVAVTGTLTPHGIETAVFTKNEVSSEKKSRLEISRYKI
jgi:hypothetical protein